MAVRFGVIFIHDSTLAINRRAEQLRSILECKRECNFILFDNKFSEITAFVVFTNESDTIFNLKNYLLVLAKNLNSRDIWYCENAIRNKNGTYNIELVSNTNDFGEVLDIVKGAFNDDLLQLLINKQNEFYFHKRIINNGLPFGIIFIASNSDNPIDIDDKTKKLESCFCDDKSNRFVPCPITIEDYLILDNLKSCFIFQDKPNTALFDNNRSFNLKKYLLGLKEKLGFEPTGIFYCENANTHKIELIGNDSDFKGVLLEFSENIPKASNEIPQFLTNFKNSKIPNKKILFSATEKYPSISPNKLCEYFKKRIRDTFERYLWHGYSKIPQEKRIAKIKEQVNEEIKLDPSFCNHRVSSEQNRKINEIAEGLKSGKIIGNVLDSAFYFIFDIGNPSQLAIKVPRKYLENDELPNTKKNIFNRLIRSIHACIDDESSFLENDKTINDLNLEDLLGQLKIQAFPLSDIITNSINQKEGVALDYALINDIKYNLLDNTFHFIFNVSNNFLSGKSRLTIEVPRRELENIKLPDMKEMCVNQWYINIFGNMLIYFINEGFYIIEGIKQEFYHSVN
ncbi:hypothetical protein [Helicobacter pylori]|uniref:hypothetical protein n=1 Tax=Helicobacter pylori TaxID=210 RepID=UPI00308F2850|nr:hypothetical protein KVE73_03130 [Helicobacter pylori]